MKASAFFPAVLLAAGLVLGVAGCAQQPTIASSHVSSGARSARTFALSVTLPDGSPITAQQWATVKAAFEQQLAAAGYRLTDDISQAERIIRVVFSPSFEDPTLGTSTVLSVRSNPMYAYNGGGYGRPAFAYGFAGYPYGDPFYGNSRYGYDYSYTYVSNPTTVTPRCDPPGTSRSRPGNDADCSPGASRGDGGQYAHHGGNGGNWGSNHGPGPSGDSGRSWNGGSSSYSRSSDSYSSPSSSYSSSSSLPSASFSSGSSSYSSSSYSGPSSSYSSSSSSSMPSASFSSGSSSSSSSGSGGSSSTTSNQNAN